VGNHVKTNKSKPDHKKYLAVQSLTNLIGVVIVVVSLAWIVFGLFGPSEGSMIEVQTFVLWFLSCFVVIQCHGAVISTRRDLIRGKWVMGQPDGPTPDGVINPWRRIGPLAIPTGIALSLATWLLIHQTGAASFKLLMIEGIAFVALFLATTVLIAIILPREQVQFAAALEGEGPGPVSSFSRYFLLEHVIPWTVIQVLINAGIGIKQFTWVLEGPEPAETITSSLVAWDFGIVFGILYFFMFLASDGQVRADVRLDRLAPKQFKMSKLGQLRVPLVALGLIVTTVLLMTVVGLIMQVILGVAGPTELSIEKATAFKAVSAMLGTFAGCGVGVWWGRQRESALMAGEKVT
jgi:hypothetical protein